MKHSHQVVKYQFISAEFQRNKNSEYLYLLLQNVSRLLKIQLDNEPLGKLSDMQSWHNIQNAIYWMNMKLLALSFFHKSELWFQVYINEKTLNVRWTLSLTVLLRIFSFFRLHDEGDLPLKGRIMPLLVQGTLTAPDKQLFHMFLLEMDRDLQSASFSLLQLLVLNIFWSILLLGLGTYIQFLLFIVSY